MPVRVAWFARSVAYTFHALLAARSSSMREALAETISRVKDSHAATRDLASGSPSATVAAWRLADDQLEYLVLSDASIVLLDRHDRSTEIVDHRLENVIARAPLDPESPAVTGAEVRAAGRAPSNRHAKAWRLLVRPHRHIRCRSGNAR